MSTIDTTLPPAEFKRQLQRRAQTEGALIAYEAAVDICRDPKAPAQAKSASLNAILRMGGYFEDPGLADVGDKPASEMTPEELERATVVAERYIAEYYSRQEAEGAEVFD